MKRESIPKSPIKGAEQPAVPRYCRLLVRFERDKSDLRLTYLGQITLMGHVESLLAGQPVGVPGDFGSGWYGSEEGWKMACAMGKSLQTPDADGAGVLDIAGQLKAEADTLALAMEEASHRNIRFCLFLEDCADPPPALAAWVAKDLAELTEDVIKMLKENGIKITA
jgi:hypothetical protein